MKINDLILKTEKIDWQNIKDLQPVNLKNNYHSEKTKNSIIKNGFARAIYVWQDSKGDIYTVDGHLRADILRELKNDGYDIPDQLNCTFLDLPNKKTAIKYLLQVFNQKTNPINQSNMEIWLDDNEIVLEDMEIELDELHIELNDELEAEEEQEEVKEDEVPEVKHNFVVKGDLFELVDEEQGLSHRVLCGDSTMIDDVEKVMNGEKADMVFTDPPYGMFLNADYSDMDSKFKGSKGGNKYDNIIGDNDDFKPQLINTIFALFNDVKEIFIWGADYFAELIPNKNDGSWVVWDKRLDESADKMYGSTFELCWSKARHKREIARIKWAGIFGIEQEFDHKRHHPTQKPVNLAIWFFKKWGKENDLVADLYLGSGSTLIACQQTKRKCYGIELDEHYTAVCVLRWKNYMEKEGKKYSIKRNGEQFTLENGSSNII